MSAADWRRVTSDKPCPVCHKPDFCLVSRDGSAALCPRTQEGAVKRVGEAGWLHRLRPWTGARGSWRRGGRIAISVIQPTNDAPPAADCKPDFAALSQQFRAAVSTLSVARLATELGVDGGALGRLGIGWAGWAWAFPHVDADGHVVGIHLRAPNGAKPYVKGSHPGLAVPTGLGECDLLIVTEGESDCAAALTLGFDAVARPGCSASTDHLRQFIRRRHIQHLVIFGDGDEEGRHGADHLAAALALTCPCVRIVFPPTTVKDLREWLGHGATRDDLQRMIENTKPYRIGIRTNVADR